MTETTNNASVALICGSAEPGHDGVGDHARRLAQTVNLLSGNAVLFALNDPYIEAPVDEKGVLPVYRLPATMPIKERMTHLQNNLNELLIEQVSLQYVPFAYHRKGLAASFIHQFKCAIGKRPLHWMCHEIWCGLSRSSRFKERILGTAQREILRVSLRSAASISTSNPDYQKRLGEITRKPVNLLPLFGNIPHQDELGSEAKLAIRKSRAPSIGPDDLVFLIFGRIAADFEHQAVFSHLNNLLAKANRIGHIVSVGRIDRGESAWESIQSNGYKQLRFNRVGELGTSELDSLIQAIDFGIVTTPLMGLGKSSSSMTILERGKIMIGQCDPQSPIGLCAGQIPDGQVLRIEDLTVQHLSQPTKFPITSHTKHTAERFLDLLKSR